MKVQVSLDEKLVERIDNYAFANYMSRSGLISFATTQYLNQAKEDFKQRIVAESVKI